MFISIPGKVVRYLKYTISRTLPTDEDLLVVKYWLNIPNLLRDCIEITYIQYWNFDRVIFTLLELYHLSSIKCHQQPIFRIILLFIIISFEVIFTYVLFCTKYNFFTVRNNTTTFKLGVNGKELCFFARLWVYIPKMDVFKNVRYFTMCKISYRLWSFLMREKTINNLG